MNDFGNTKSNGMDAHNKSADGIYYSILKQFKDGDYQRAAERLKRALERYPDSEKLRGLLVQLRQNVRNKKIKKLEEEAVILMQKGSEDEAQKRLREIYRLDPSRTDLKEAVNIQLRSENLREYNTKVRRLEISRDFILAFLCILAVVGVLMSWAIWDNKKCIRIAKDHIDDRSYSSAIGQLESCGWLFAGEKKVLQKELLLITNDLRSQAEEFAINKEYNKAIKALTKASTASSNPAEFDDQLRQFRDLEQTELEHKKQMHKAKSKCEQVAQVSHDVGAEVEVPHLWREANELSGIAEKLMVNRDFVNSSKKWIEATQKYNEASMASEKIVEERNSALLARDQFQDIFVIAREANSEIEAPELWDELISTSTLANKHLQEKLFVQAQQGWIEAASKCGKALDISRQSPSYKLASEEINKWQEITLGMTESSVSSLLGDPKCCVLESNRCIFYYQNAPRIVPDSNGIGSDNIIEPGCGYIIFTNSGFERTLEGIEKKYKKELKREDRRHEAAIKKAERMLQGGASELLNEKQYIDSLHRDKIQEIQKDYESEKTKVMDGLTPIKSAYVVSSWEKPNPDDVIGLLASPVSFAIESDSEWKLPENWKKLKVNMPQQQVDQILGGNLIGKRACSFGNIQGYGVVTFKKRKDGIWHLDYWKEPFWPSVKEDQIIVTDSEDALVQRDDMPQRKLNIEPVSYHQSQ